MRDEQTKGPPSAELEESTEKVNASRNRSVEIQDMHPSVVKLPFFLRWPLILVLLFIVPPYGTIAGLILAVIRLVFSHKHPEYKLKMRTKVIISVLCAAFVAWSMTLEPSEPSVSAESPSSIQSTQDSVPPADTQTAPASEAAPVSDDAQAEGKAKQREKAYKKIEKALKKEEVEKAAKALAKIDEAWSFSYYQDLLQDPIADHDTDQLQKYLSIYRQSYPNTDKMHKVLAAWDEICANGTAIDELDAKYRSPYGGMEDANRKAESAEERMFYVQYKLKSTMANSDNDIISAIGEAIDSLQESANEEYEYLANNVTNNLLPSLVIGYVDLNVYAGDERYVLVCDKPFSQSGVTTVYAYENGTRTLSTTDGFEQEVPCYQVVDAAVIDTVRADYEKYSLLIMRNAELYEQMKHDLTEA